MDIETTDSGLQSYGRFPIEIKIVRFLLVVIIILSHKNTIMTYNHKISHFNFDQKI